MLILKAVINSGNGLPGWCGTARGSLRDKDALAQDPKVVEDQLDVRGVASSYRPCLQFLSAVLDAPLFSSKVFTHYSNRERELERIQTGGIPCLR